MKKIFITVFVILLFSIFHAITTLTDGNWDDANIWSSGTVPSASDDVVVTRLVTIGSLAECSNLTLLGADAMIRNHSQIDGILNIYGNLVSSGWIASNNSNNRYLTCNLYGNLESTYNFTPGTFNVLGSGNRSWSTDSDSFISPYFNINVAASIDTIFATGDINISSAHSSANTNLSCTDSSFLIVLTNPDTRVAHNINITNCIVTNGRFEGSGTNTFTWNNNRNGYLNSSQLCSVSLFTPFSMWINDGVTLKQLTNNGIIYNATGTNRTVYIEDSFVNNGTIANNPQGYGITMNCSGNISNSGTFAPLYMNMTGSGERTLYCSADHPFRVQASINVSVNISSIQALSDLWFYDTDQIINGFFSFVNGTGAGWAMHAEGVAFTGTTFEGESGSMLYSIDSSFNSANISNMHIAAGSTVNVLDNCVLNNCFNYGIIQNHNSYHHTLIVNGSFENHGIIRNHPSGYNLTLNMSGDIRNQGLWTCSTLNLTGSAIQTISFPAAYPMKANIFAYNGTATSINIAPSEDLAVENCTMDFNGKILQMPAGSYTLMLTNCLLREAVVQCQQTNQLNFTNSEIETCSFQGITNIGTFSIRTETIIYGSMLNLGTIQNSSNYYQSLIIQQNLVNNGSIRNNPSGYGISVYVAEDVTNSGSFICNNLYLNGTQPQYISFPQAYPFQGANLIKTNAAQALICSSDLYIMNCQIDLNSSNLDLISVGSHNMHLSNCILKECNVISNLNSTLEMLNGGYLEWVNFQSIQFSGLVSIATETHIYGDLLNLGILQNNSNYYQSLYVVNISNNGTIRNNPSGYNLNPHISGNLANMATISCSNIYIDGGYCLLSNSGTMSCTSMSITTSGAQLVLANNMTFTNMYMDFIGAGGGYLSLSGIRNGVTLNMDGGSISHAQIIGGGGATLNGINYFVLRLSSADILETSGSIYIDDVSVGHLINHGTIKNHSDYFETLVINGNLENYGSILNSTSYNLSLALRADIYNYSVININRMSFIADEDQRIYQGPAADTLRITLLDKYTTSGNLILLSDLKLQNTYINLQNHQLVMTVPPKTAPVSNVYIGTLTSSQYKLTLVRSLTSVNLY